MQQVQHRALNSESRIAFVRHVVLERRGNVIAEQVGEQLLTDHFVDDDRDVRTGGRRGPTARCRLVGRGVRRCERERARDERNDDGNTTAHATSSPAATSPVGRGSKLLKRELLHE